MERCVNSSSQGCEVYQMVDSYPIGSCNDNINRLAHSSIFSTLDGEGAFHQVEVAPEDQHKTAFSTPFGVYQFRYMPFGLCNAPSTYSCLVAKVLEGIPWSEALPFIDDTIVHTKTLDEHIQSLDKVLAAFSKAGLKLGPSKCHLFRSRVKFLRHYVDAKGVHVDPDYIKAVESWPVPRSRWEIRIFYGKFLYYEISKP